MIEWSKSNDALGTVNRGNPKNSGLCTLCRADCKGKCETFLSSLKGRKMLYPRDFWASDSGKRQHHSHWSGIQLIKDPGIQLWRKRTG